MTKFILKLLVVIKFYIILLIYFSFNVTLMSRLRKYILSLKQLSLHTSFINLKVLILFIFKIYIGYWTSMRLFSFLMIRLDWTNDISNFIVINNWKL